MPKISIERVDNGFIVVITNQGESNLKTLYTNPKLVFPNFTRLKEWLSGWAGQAGDNHA